MHCLQYILMFCLWICLNWFLKTHRLRVIVMTKPQIKPFRPKWRMLLSLRTCQAYRNLVSFNASLVCSSNSLLFFIILIFSRLKKRPLMSSHTLSPSIICLLGGSEKLLRVCLNLPYFLRYINRFQDAVSANSFFIMPATVADATAVRNGYLFVLNLYDLMLKWIFLLYALFWRIYICMFVRHSKMGIHMFDHSFVFPS